MRPFSFRDSVARLLAGRKRRTAKQKFFHKLVLEFLEQRQLLANDLGPSLDRDPVTPEGQLPLLDAYHMASDGPQETGVGSGTDAWDSTEYGLKYPSYNGAGTEAGGYAPGSGSGTGSGYSSSSGTGTGIGNYTLSAPYPEVIEPNRWVTLPGSGSCFGSSSSDRVTFEINDISGYGNPWELAIRIDATAQDAAVPNLDYLLTLEHGSIGITPDSATGNGWYLVTVDRWYGSWPMVFSVEALADDDEKEPDPEKVTMQIEWPGATRKRATVNIRESADGLSIVVGQDAKEPPNAANGWFTVRPTDANARLCDVAILIDPSVAKSATPPATSLPANTPLPIDYDLEYR